MPKTRKQPAMNGAGQARTYSVYFQRERKGLYTAHIPALDVVTEGRTLAEARQMAIDAIAGWIEAAQELGKPIPDDVPTALVEVAL